eukprot:scpid46799/ scgid34957/ Tripeptidyl-peptidase 1; Tripeptidyl aminopeptidase; Tripeptidyl-peptidase I
MAVVQVILACVGFLVCCASLSVGTRVRLEADQLLAREMLDWKVIGQAKPHEQHQLVFALRQSNIEHLEKKLMAVSTPGNPEYGRFLRAEQVNDLVRPRKESLRAVERWLTSADVSASKSCRYTAAQEFLHCDVSVAEASRLLEVRFERYQKGALTVLRAAEHYTVPAEAAEHVDFVGGAHRLPVEHGGIKMPKKTSQQNGGGGPPKQMPMKPSILREYYEVRDEVGAGTASRNIQGVSQFAQQYYSVSDLGKFMSEFNGNVTSLANVSKQIGENPGPSTEEASMDIQYLMSLGSNIPTWSYYTTGDLDCYLSWIMTVANMSTIPNVFSVSYGNCEVEFSQTYLQRMNVEFAKVGVRGTTLLFASGDSGGGCNGTQDCPTFPASSPYVTSVGATSIGEPGNMNQSAPEVSIWFSGGGFSRSFPRPSYQDAVVEKFLRTAERLPSADYFNRSNRAFPDVAAIGADFNLVSGGDVLTMWGTSCSVPTFAGIISLVNDRLVNEHSATPLGFLNPLLYQEGGIGATALTDILAGYTAGCNMQPAFYAQRGWDPTTGFGSPRFPALLAAALKAKGIH